MPEKVSSKICGALGRLILLALLAGHLLFRREFAHRNLGELFSWLHIPAPEFAAKLYVTECALAVLLPLMLLVLASYAKRTEGPADENALVRGAGASFYFALLFLGW